MQAIDQIKNKAKPLQSIQISGSTYLTLKTDHLEKEQVCLIKEGKCFNFKERSYTAYNFLKKREITTILEDISKNSNNLQKKLAFSKVEEKTLFISSVFMLEVLFCDSFSTI